MGTAVVRGDDDDDHDHDGAFLFVEGVDRPRTASMPIFCLLWHRDQSAEEKAAGFGGVHDFWNSHPGVFNLLQYLKQLVRTEFDNWFLTCNCSTTPKIGGCCKMEWGSKVH